MLWSFYCGSWLWTAGDEQGCLCRPPPQMPPSRQRSAPPPSHWGKGEVSSAPLTSFLASPQPFNFGFRKDMRLSLISNKATYLRM